MSIATVETLCTFLFFASPALLAWAVNENWKIFPDHWLDD